MLCQLLSYHVLATMRGSYIVCVNILQLFFLLHIAGEYTDIVLARKRGENDFLGTCAFSSKCVWPFECDASEAQSARTLFLLARRRTVRCAPGLPASWGSAQHLDRWIPLLPGACLAVHVCMRLTRSLTWALVCLDTGIPMQRADRHRACIWVERARDIT